MNERVNACLDGELGIQALSAAEQAEVEAVRAIAERVRAVLPGAPAGLPDAVLRRVHELGLQPAASPAGDVIHRGGTRVAARLRQVLAAAWRPRVISFGFRPAYAAGLLAVAAALLLGRGAGEAPLADLPLASAPPVYVQFRLDAAGAGSVALAGSFSEWEPRHQLVETRPGVWTLVLALHPGVHDYAFLVDGERWVIDPAAPYVADGFGGRNSRLALLPAGGTDL